MNPNDIKGETASTRCNPCTYDGDCKTCAKEAREKSNKVEYQCFVMNESVMNYLLNHFGMNSNGYTNAQLKQAEEAVLLDGLRVLKRGMNW